MNKHTAQAYLIPDDALVDLASAMVMLRAMSQHYPRLDRMGQINIDIAVDAMQAILDLANAQHPVPRPAAQASVASRRATLA
ncbi:MAG: hypothetical protein E6Q97_05715 [Desulfurellales bacterium]|nr:MAG: hypothetical protein E6Q97_05715 [Desulfurellales bacterium]